MTIAPTRDRARNADFADLVAMLRDQQGRKLDIVAPASQILFRGGLLHLRGTEAVLTDDGVSQADGVYRPTGVFDEGLAAKLGIPVAYVRRMRIDRPDLYDANANGWLHGRQRRTAEGTEIIHAGDPRSFMLRLFQGNGDEGVARSMHSSKYARIDHLDVVTAVLQGIQDAGVEPVMDRCDLTDKKMYIRVTVPGIEVLAPALLRNYRSPFSGATGADNPVIWGGLKIENSETGYGAATITPSFIVQVCSNGMTITKDAVRSVHLGGRMDDGVVEWSADTQTKQLAVITARARDSVRTFLNVEYMTQVIRGLEEQAGVEVAKPADEIKRIGKALSFDQGTIDGVLDHFIRGGDITAGGVMHAVTSFAQTVADADAAHDIEAAGLRALELAAARH